MVAIPGVKFVAKMAGKIPGYKSLAKIGIGKKTVKAVRKTAGIVGTTAGIVGNTASRGVGAIRTGAVAVGKTSRNVARGTRRGLNRVRRFFGMKSRSKRSEPKRSRKSKPRSVRRSVRRNTRKSINRIVKFAPNMRNKANAKPIERELTPMPVVAAPVAAKAFPAKAFNSPIGVAVGNMSVAPKPY
jgi:hypothetical protein